MDPFVLFQDNALVAINKPSGMIVHRGWANDRETAMSLVRDRLGQKVYPVHRLDRGTSGVLLLALSPDVARAVQEALQGGLVEKRYLTLVRGIPPSSGTIDHAVPRVPKGERVHAVTDFRRLAVFERYALVEARPRTGRLHQIRRHMKHKSWHVIGDVNYGKGEHNRLFRQRFGLHRLALHALVLKLPHPTTREMLCLTAPLPADLARPLMTMGLMKCSVPDGSQKSYRPE